MRILAIRGQNLASLARSFAIDFAAGPSTVHTITVTSSVNLRFPIRPRRDN